MMRVTVLAVRAMLMTAVLMQLLGLFEIVALTGNAGKSDGGDQQGNQFHGPAI